MKLVQIIPPLSVVRLVHTDDRTPLWKKQLGRSFRIGYYSRQDGTDCVWLVNDAGEYEQTVDQEQIHTYFEIVERSKVRTLFGDNRTPIPPLPRRRRQTSNGTNGTPKFRSRTGHHVAT